MLNNFVVFYADSEDPDAAGPEAVRSPRLVDDYAYVDVTYADEFNSVLTLVNR